MEESKFWVTMLSALPPFTLLNQSEYTQYVQKQIFCYAV
jgi:hypothetical protein